MTSKSWDDIDLGGLTMEGSGDDSDANSEEKQRRVHKRMDIKNLLQVAMDKIDAIPVKVTSVDGRNAFMAKLLDISEGGMKILSQGFSSVNDIMIMNFTIGKRTIATRGIVRWAKPEQGKEALGIEFINPQQKDIDFISSIHSALRMRKY